MPDPLTLAVTRALQNTEEQTPANWVLNGDRDKNLATRVQWLDDMLYGLYWLGNTVSSGDRFHLPSAYNSGDGVPLLPYYYTKANLIGCLASLEDSINRRQQGITVYLRARLAQPAEALQDFTMLRGQLRSTLTRHDSLCNNITPEVLALGRQKCCPLSADTGRLRRQYEDTLHYRITGLTEWAVSFQGTLVWNSFYSTAEDIAYYAREVEDFETDDVADLIMHRHRRFAGLSVENWCESYNYNINNEPVPYNTRYISHDDLDDLDDLDDYYEDQHDYYEDDNDVDDDF